MPVLNQRQNKPELVKLLTMKKILQRDIALLALDFFIQYFCIKTKILVEGLGRDSPKQGKKANECNEVVPQTERLKNG